MTTWNYRLFRDDDFITIREVYYEADEPQSHTRAVAASGDDVDEIKRELERMLLACDKPVLSAEDFPQFEVKS